MKECKYLLDSTLRDGEQTPGICFTAEQKMAIASLLDSFGIHHIESGVPSISKHEKDTISKIIANKKNAIISVWARLTLCDINHAIDVRPDLIHVSVPVSDLHINKKLHKDKDWIVNQLHTCLDLINKSGIPVSVGFEDTFRSNLDFLLTICKILLDYNVKRIRLADTVGTSLPSVCREFVSKLLKELDNKVELGFHAHNDLGMAVANTIEAVKAGCLYADVTVAGIGERAGNCDMAQLVHASSSVFDWGISSADAKILQKEIFRIMRK